MLWVAFERLVPVVLVLLPLLIACLLLAVVVVAGPLDLELVRVLDVVIGLFTIVMHIEHLLWRPVMVAVPVQVVRGLVVLVPRLLSRIVIVVGRHRPDHLSGVLGHWVFDDHLSGSIRSLALVLHKLEFFIREQVLGRLVVREDRLWRVVVMMVMMMDFVMLEGMVDDWLRVDSDVVA